MPAHKKPTKTAAKKAPAKRKAPAKKAAAKPMSKAQFTGAMADKWGVPKAEAKRMLESLEDVAVTSAKKHGRVATPLGNLKVAQKKGIRKGTMVRNPFTGETKPHPGKPASKTFKVQVPKSMRDRA